MVVVAAMEWVVVVMGGGSEMEMEMVVVVTWGIGGGNEIGDGADGGGDR